MSEQAPCPVCSSRFDAGTGARVRCQCGAEFEVVSKQFGSAPVMSSELLRLGWRRASDAMTSIGRVAMIADGSGTEAARIGRAMVLEEAARDYLRRYDCSTRPWLVAALYESGHRVDGLWLQNDGRGWRVTRRSLDSMAQREVDVLADRIAALSRADALVARAWSMALRERTDDLRVILTRFLSEYEARAGRTFELE